MTENNYNDVDNSKKYICSNCGLVSDKSGQCSECGTTLEKTCDCGSGLPKSECCAGDYGDDDDLEDDDWESDDNY